MTHSFKASRSQVDRSCQVKGCGLIRGNEVHGHSCNGKQLIESGMATCYECGRTIPVGGPIRTNTARTKIGGGAQDFPDYC